MILTICWNIVYEKFERKHMTIKEFTILNKYLKKAKISRISEDITNDYFWGIDKALIKEKDLEKIDRYILISDFKATNLHKNVVIFPKDIFEHFSGFRNKIGILFSTILSIIAICISIICLCL